MELPGQHILNVSTTCLGITPNLGDSFTSQDCSWQIGGKYNIPLPEALWIHHQVSLGFDFKQSNNNLDFSGASVFASATDVD